MKLTILIATISTLVLVNSAAAVNPFCKFCNCKLEQGNITKEIRCRSRSLKLEQIFEPAFWFRNATNESYPVELFSVQNLPITVLDKPFVESALRTLDLANNYIFNVSNGVFAHLQEMETLVLSNNQIETLHPDAFKGLYLQGDFMPLKSLKTLLLDHNRIHSLDGNIFEHTSRVEELHLGHNPLKVIDHQTLIALTSLVYLKTLDLTSTGLKELPEHFMHTPKYLSWLDLSSNAFEAVPPTLGESHSLQVLNMSDNQFVNLTEETGFPSIRTLKVLHLCNIDTLKSVGGQSLSKLDSLEELHLADNIELAHIDRNALSAKRNEAEYETWPPLKKLFLQNNKITRIDLHLFPNLGGLSELNLLDNPWTCECENQWMVDELVPIYLKIDETKAKLLKCAAPIEMQQYTFYDIFEKHSEMRCLDYYGHQPEKDAALLVGLLAGLLLSIPLILFIIYSYQRHWFGIFDDSPAAFSRTFYKRTQNSDDFL